MLAPAPTVDLTCDVLVVGAGPAGATAATYLARAGRRVVVVDKATFPRDKCCGDGLTTLALRELDALGLEPASVPNWQPVRDVWLRSPSGREIELQLPDDGQYAATAPRRELDSALVEVARDAGADVRDGHGVVALRQDAAKVVATVDGIGEVASRFVIAADGMWSPVRKLLGHAEDGYLGEWHAFRQYASDVTGPAADRLYVWFEPDLLPGYAWSFPLPDGRVNLGYGVLRDGTRNGGDLRELWSSLWTRPHIAGALGPDVTFEGRYTAWPIPAGIDRATLADGRVLFVGDAAMATDTMTGEGIGQAVLTGRLAAEAVLLGGALQATATATAYETAAREHLVGDHRMSALLSRALRHELGARGALRLVEASGEWGKRNFARWMFEDEPRAIAVTPRRWHRHVLARPGAYRPGTVRPCARD